VAGNTFGRLFRVTTFGESHGRGVGAVVDGVPPGIPLPVEYIQRELDRRRPGQSAVTSRRREPDTVQILSGLFEGKTTGTPLMLFIANEEYRSSDYENLKDIYRPGHADYTYEMKYGLRDWRGSGRSSGRETAARVAAGAVAGRILELSGVEVVGYTLEIGGVRAEAVHPVRTESVEKNAVRSPDEERAKEMVRRIEEAKAAGDSLGGIVEVVVRGVPAGAGDPVFDKLEALMAHAVMSIGGVRGFEIGAGFGSARMTGSHFNDSFIVEKGNIRTETNNAGGVLGGIATGEDILFRAAVRPPASIGKEQKTVNRKKESAAVRIGGRHDPCIVPRIVPVVEAMTRIVLLDCMLVQKAQKPGGIDTESG